MAQSMGCEVSLTVQVGYVADAAKLVPQARMDFRGLCGHILLFYACELCLCFFGLARMRFLVILGDFLHICGGMGDPLEGYVNWQSCLSSKHQEKR